MDRTGIENESELRSATNAAVLANMAIYTMDIRGLQALPPGGAAQNASLRGISPYNGQSTLNDLNSNFTTQETLVSLSVDTGGRAYLDSNDFTASFAACSRTWTCTICSATTARIRRAMESSGASRCG